MAYPVEVEDESLQDNAESHLPPSCNDCWLYGWNFVTDLYRVLEHALIRFRGKQNRSQRRGFLTNIYQDQMMVTAASIHASALDMYTNLPDIFKQTLQMTYDSKKDLFGFQAANITASF